MNLIKPSVMTLILIASCFSNLYSYSEWMEEYVHDSSFLLFEHYECGEFYFSYCNNWEKMNAILDAIKDHENEVSLKILKVNLEIELRICRKFILKQIERAKESIPLLKEQIKSSETVEDIKNSLQEIDLYHEQIENCEKLISAIDQIQKSL